MAVRRQRYAWGVRLVGAMLGATVGFLAALLFGSVVSYLRPIQGWTQVGVTGGVFVLCVLGAGVGEVAAKKWIYKGVATDMDRLLGLAVREFASSGNSAVLRGLAATEPAHVTRVLRAMHSEAGAEEADLLCRAADAVGIKLP